MVRGAAAAHSAGALLNKGNGGGDGSGNDADGSGGGDGKEEEEEEEEEAPWQSDTTAPGLRFPKALHPPPLFFAPRPCLCDGTHPPPLVAASAHIAGASSSASTHKLARNA
mmetsp:Transcript_71424/g.134601  ORF Transcript_71424/g.134601 Transcript_71424/m.134601 type:complete len:111 (-) Transcript_71424:577-909(-)